MKIFLRCLKNKMPITYTKIWRWFFFDNVTFNSLLRSFCELINNKSNGKQIIFVDCGANDGSVSKYMLRHLPRDSVFVAIELQGALAEYLKRVFPKIETINAAASDETGSTDVYVPKSYGPRINEGASIVENKVSTAELGDMFTCKTINLVQLIKQKKAVHKNSLIVVKLDVEGAEFKIIESIFKNFQDTGEKLIDLLAVEFHPDVLVNEKEEKYQSMLDQMQIDYMVWT